MWGKILGGRGGQLRSAYNDIPSHNMAFFSTNKNTPGTDFQKEPDFTNQVSPWETPAEDEGDTAGENYFVGTTQNDSPFGDDAPQIPSSTNSNVLNSDVTVVGTLRFIDDLLVDGIVEGEILSEGVLTVGSHARISGTEKDRPAIRTKSAIIHGQVIGNVVVSERVELAKTAILQGDITAGSISIQEGAQVVGHVQAGAGVGIESPIKGITGGTMKPSTQPGKGPEGDSSNLLV